MARRYTTTADSTYAMATAKMVSQTTRRSLGIIRLPTFKQPAPPRAFRDTSARHRAMAAAG